MSEQRSPAVTAEDRPPQIHPLAVADSRAELAAGVVIGPGAVVGPEVRIGSNTWVGPHAVLDGRLVIGDHNKIFPGACLGLEPQDLKYKGAPTEVVIGHHDAIAQQTVMPQMAVGHQKVVVANTGLLPLVSRPIDRDAFTDGVVMSDHHLCRSSLVLEILRLQPEASTGEDLVVVTDHKSTIKHRVRPDPGI